MKKFLVLGLVLFGFSSVFAAYESSNTMDYSDAEEFCRSNKMRLASRSEIPDNGLEYWASGKIKCKGRVCKKDPYGTARAACVR